jgi:hypothetical protein
MAALRSAFRASVWIAAPEADDGLGDSPVIASRASASQTVSAL